MTRRDPNAPNPYHLLAQLREEEMAERARLAARGMAVAPLHTPSPHLVSPGMGMWALARLEWADWSDLTDEEAEAVVCTAKLDVEDDPSDWETPTCAGTA